MKKIFIILLCVSYCALYTSLQAQEEIQDLYSLENIETIDSLSLQEDSIEVKLTTRDYFNLLTTPDSLTGAVINIIQDPSIFTALEKKIIGDVQEVKGFRIQIYSSNRGASARERAFAIKDILVSKYPQLVDEVYVTYTSPFWKVRIGNCENYTKAQELRQWIITEFPEFTTETYIVPSVILVYY